MNKRKIVVNMVENEKIYNQRLVEYFARKFNERNVNNEKI